MRWRLLLIFCVLFVSGYSQIDSVELITIGTRNPEKAINIQQINNSEFFISGDFTDEIINRKGQVFLWLDSNLSLNKTLKYSPSNVSQLVESYLLPNNSIFILSQSLNEDSLNQQYFTVSSLLDSSGNESWSYQLKELGHHEYAKDLLVINDTFFTLTEQQSQFQKSFRLFAAKASGEILFNEILSIDSLRGVNGICRYENSLLITGTKWINSQTYAPLIISYDLSVLGNFIKINSLASFPNVDLKKIEYLKDSSFFVGGFKQNPTNRDIFLANLDKAFKPIWTREIGLDATDEFNAIELNQNNTDYLLCGFTASFGSGGKDGFVTYLDKDGNEKLGSKTFGFVGEDVLTDVIFFKNGYIAVGSTTSYGNGLEDIWIVKRDTLINDASTSETQVSIAFPEGETVLNIKHRPIKENIVLMNQKDRFAIHSELEKIKNIKVYSTHGKLVLESAKTFIPKNTLTSGVYIIVVSTEEKQVSFKVSTF